MNLSIPFLVAFIALRILLHGTARIFSHHCRKGICGVWRTRDFNNVSEGENGISTYFMDILDYKLWTQSIDVGGRKMATELVEIT